jgi:hypothetical protein
MFLVNLAAIGPVAPFVASPEDLRQIYSAAVQVWERTPHEVLTDTLTQWETGLTWRSLETEPVDAAWYVRALLVTCLRGLRGESAPIVWPLTPDH